MMRATSRMVSFSETVDGFAVMMSRTRCELSWAMSPPSADESAAAKRSKRRAPARTSEREAQAAGNRHDRSLEIEENAVISRLGHESDAARDREVAIHAAGKSVPALIRFARVRLTIKTNAGKESGRTVRLG